MVSQQGDNNNVHLKVAELRRLSDAYVPPSPLFEPRSSIDKRESGATTSAPPTRELRAPEKRLTLFALRLAVLEKAATGSGTLGFIWATVVLLGGFAITLDKTDFWFITIILLTEGTRIFSRSHELEWQHQSTWSLTDTGINSFRILKSSSRSLARVLRSLFGTIRRRNQRGREIADHVLNTERSETWIAQKLQSRQWKSSDVPLLPYDRWLFLSRNTSKLLHWLQIVAALLCVSLSLFKLIKHNYGDIEKGDADKRNLKAALVIFYSLALSEALLFLLEKVYWELKVIYWKVLEDVSKECELGPEGLVSVKRFFYDAYSRCLNGSIFDGLKMDMVSFAMELVGSNSTEEQLIGARILRKFSTSERFSDDTLQKIGVNLSVMERLVEILNWKDPQEEEIRQSAAIILSKLAGKKQNSLRVAGIPGAMESISSLLYTNRNSSYTADEVGDKCIIFDHEHYGLWTFNHLGLVILKKLARNHDNCGKIGNARGLLPKIIDFTHVEERILKDGELTSRILTVKRSLQVVRMLASTTAAIGKQLRQEISECVFTISNIRDILRYGDKHQPLQHLGIQVLTKLALEEDARERIGGTGGVLTELLKIFFKDGMAEDQDGVRNAAGEALAMLALESKSNCLWILRAGAMDKLVSSLDVPLLRENAARILRNLCTYSSDDCFDSLSGVIVAAPTVVKGIMSEESKLQELMVGLAAHAFKFMTPEESSAMFGRARITEEELCSKLVHILNNYPNPPTRIPRVRRFTIELAIWMMRNRETSKRHFRIFKLDKELENVLDTTSEIESFNIFSGTVGLSRYQKSIHALVETALELLS